MGNIASPKILSPRSPATAVAVDSVGGRAGGEGAGMRAGAPSVARSHGCSAGRPDERGAVFAASAAAAVSCMSLTLSNEERLHQSESGVGGGKKVKKPEARRRLWLSEGGGMVKVIAIRARAPPGGRRG